MKYTYMWWNIQNTYISHICLTNNLWYITCTCNVINFKSICIQPTAGLFGSVGSSWFGRVLLFQVLWSLPTSKDSASGLQTNRGLKSQRKFQPYHRQIQFHSSVLCGRKLINTQVPHLCSSCNSNKRNITAHLRWVSVVYRQLVTVHWWPKWSVKLFGMFTLEVLGILLQS